MAKTDWVIKGTLNFIPQHSEVEGAYGSPVPLSGVKVLVEAKEIAADPTWDNWGEDVTNAEGGFRITNEKDRSPRMFRVRAMFKNDDLKIYPPNTSVLAKAIDSLPGRTVVEAPAETALEQALAHTTRLMFDVDWFTIHQDDKDHKHEPDVVDLKELTFQSGGHHDLGDRTARRHAEIWFVCRKVMGLLEDAGSGLGFPKGKPVALLHPHNNDLIGDAVETSFASPYNNVAFLVENSHVDGFDLTTIIHELMHLWVYQRSQGEDALAWQLLIHGSTHEGLQKKTWVAAHEGIAEWATHQLHRVLFGVWPTVGGQDFQAKGLPFTRQFLGDRGVTVLQDVDRSEYGWMSLLNILRNSDVATVDVTGTGEYAPQNMSPPRSAPKGVPVEPLAVGGSTPGFLDVLTVLNEHPQLGVVGREQLNLEAFVDRALAIMPQHAGAEKNKIIELLNPRPNAGTGPPVKQREPKPQAQVRTARPEADDRGGNGRGGKGQGGNGQGGNGRGDGRGGDDGGDAQSGAGQRHRVPAARGDANRERPER